MANYECTTRTNYFRVTDEEKYKELFFVTDEDIQCECQESRPDFVERYDKMTKEQKMKFLSKLSTRMKDTFVQSRRFDWRQLVLDGLAWVEEDEQQESHDA